MSPKNQKPLLSKFFECQFLKILLTIFHTLLKCIRKCGWFGSKFYRLDFRIFGVQVSPPLGGHFSMVEMAQYGQCLVSFLKLIIFNPKGSQGPPWGSFFDGWNFLNFLFFCEADPVECWWLCSDRLSVQWLQMDSRWSLDLDLTSQK